MGAKTGKTQVLVILSSFCDLVHAESVVDLFVKQLNNALNVPKITNRRAIFHKRPSRRAVRLKTGDLGTLLMLMLMH